MGESLVLHDSIAYLQLPPCSLGQIILHAIHTIYVAKRKQSGILQMF